MVVSEILYLLLFIYVLKIGSQDWFYLDMWFSYRLKLLHFSWFKLYKFHDIMMIFYRFDTEAIFIKSLRMLNDKGNHYHLEIKTTISLDYLRIMLTWLLKFVCAEIFFMLFLVLHRTKTTHSSINIYWYDDIIYAQTLIQLSKLGQVIITFLILVIKKELLLLLKGQVVLTIRVENRVEKKI